MSWKSKLFQRPDRIAFTRLAGTMMVVLMALTGRVGAEETETSSNLKRLSIEQLMEVEIAVVSGASTFKQKITEAPSSISIITAEDIKKYGYRTLAEILKSVRGFFVTYDRNYSYLGVRGFGRPGDYNSRILLLIDGHRINDNIYDSLYLGTDFILDIDLIDRMEIVRGPGSSLYGSNAFFASIHIFTKKGEHLKGVEVSGEAGSLDSYKGRLSYGDRYSNGLEALFSASHYESQGNNSLYYKEYDRSSTNSGLAQNCDLDRAANLFTNLSYKDFTLQGAVNERKKTIPTGSYGTDFNNPGNQTIDGRAYMDLKYRRTLQNDLDLTARLFYDYYRYKGDYLYDGVINKDSTLGEWWGLESRVTGKWFNKHRVTFGLEYVDNINQNQHNNDDSPYALYLDDKRKSKNWALYFQDEFSILPNLILNAGLRYDYFETFGGTTNPRLALIYSPLEKTTLKLLYGSAFRAPNAYELYYHDQGRTSKPNPDLKEETIKTYELVYEQYFGKHFRGTTSFYYYTIDHLINQIVDPEDGLLAFRNIGNMEAKGFEVELEGKGWNGVDSRISYAFQEAVNKDTGETLTNSPRHLAKLNVSFPLLKEKVFISPEIQYASQRKTLAGTETADVFTMNLTLFTRKWIQGLEISGSIYNLFNATSGDPVGAELRQETISQDGRTLRLKLTYRF
jgi:outer membrane receptor for ferrienterochelin and colicins